MIILDVNSEEFKEYGKVIENDYTEFLTKLKRMPCPDKNTVYIPSEKVLEEDEIYKFMKKDVFGGMSIQIGYCNGYNQKLNCLEYHKSSEVNIAATDVILLLGKLQQIKNGKFDTKNIKAFLLKKNESVELYATTLHYAPCGVNGNTFQVAVVLPYGTNFEKDNSNDVMLWAKNKWLLSHNDSDEAKLGAYVGLTGENISV